MTFNVRDSAYAILHAQLQCCWPSVANDYPKPELPQKSHRQRLTHTRHHQHQPTPTSHNNGHEPLRQPPRPRAMTTPTRSSGLNRRRRMCLLQPERRPHPGVQGPRRVHSLRPRHNSCRVDSPTQRRPSTKRRPRTRLPSRYGLLDRRTIDQHLCNLARLRCPTTRSASACLPDHHN